MLPEKIANRYTDYKLLSCLHDNEVSQVYKAQRVSDNASVILRIHNYQEGTNLTEYSRLKSSADILAKLKHPNIVGFIDLLDADDSIALAVEDTGSITLAEYLDAYTEGRVTLEVFLDIAEQLSSALSYVHSQGIIHKDLHPGNILISPSNHKVHLIDFDLATFRNSEQQSFCSINQLEGVLEFISPEQTGRMNTSLDYRSDLYSLGCIFYFLLSGQAPFEFSDPLVTLHSHIAVRAKPLYQKVGEKIPLVINDLVDKLLDKTQEERYQSASGVLADIRRCAQSFKSSGSVDHFKIASEDVPSRYRQSSTMYGRDQELSQLHTTFDRIVHADARIEILMVRGEGGIGKSSYVSDLHKPISKYGGTFLKGKFDEKETLPYAAFISVFDSWREQLTSEPSYYQQQVKTSIAEQMEEDLPYLMHLIPNLDLLLELDIEPIEMNSNAQRERLSSAVCKLIKHIASNQTLVIFIDDVQWMDAGSLGLLDSLSQIKDARILFIFAYRNDEKTFQQTKCEEIVHIINGLSKNVFALSALSLEPLKVEDIVQMLMDSFFTNKSESAGLARLIFEKTKGNPFEINELLQCFVDNGFVQFDVGSNRWIWGLSEVVKYYSDQSVEDIALESFDSLDAATRRLVSTASCVGFEFDLKVLADMSGIILKDAFDMFKAALDKGLVAYSHKRVTHKDHSEVSNYFHFVHDKVMERAYARLSAHEKSENHFMLGNMALEQIDLDARDARIFQVVDHLNKAVDHYSVDFCKSLAELNFQAAEEAKQGGVWHLAQLYAEHGLRHLKWFSEQVAENIEASDDRLLWQGDYALCFKLKELLSEMLYLQAELEASDKLFDELLTFSNSVQEKAALYSTQLVRAMSRGQWQQAIKIGVKGLSLFEIDIAEDESLGKTLRDEAKEQVVKLAENNTSKLSVPHKGRRIICYDQLPFNDDGGLHLKMLLLNNLGQCAQVCSIGWLYELCTFRALKLSFDEGRSAYTALTLSCYSQILALHNELSHAVEIAEQACQLIEQHQRSKDVSNAYNMLAAFIWFYRYSISECVDLHEKGYLAGLKNGELWRSVINKSNQIFHRYSHGEPLTELLKLADQARKMSEEKAIFFVVGHTYGALIHSLIEGKNLLSDEALGLSLVEKIEGTVHQQHLHSCRLSYFFWSDQLDEALKQADHVGELAIARHSKFIFHFDDCFTYAYLMCRFQSRAEFLGVYDPEKLDYAFRQINMAAELNPGVFEHKKLLLKAERLRKQSSNFDGIVKAYREAINSSKQAGFIQFEALSNELLAWFWREKDLSVYGEGHIARAHKLYYQWGANVKAESVESRFEWFDSLEEAIELFDTKKVTRLSHFQTKRDESQEEGPYGEMSEAKKYGRAYESWKNHNDPQTIYRTSHVMGLGDSDLSQTLDSLDVKSLIKTNHAISGEIELPKLLAKFLNVVIESAGAEQGALVTLKDGRPVVQGYLSMAKKKESLFEEMYLSECDFLPESIIAKSMRLFENIVVDDAIKNPKYQTDMYVRIHKPRSLLSMPLFYQGRLQGVLYLDNRLMPSVFTKKRIEILEILTSQAAISFENASLFKQVSELNKDLEGKVEERTLELKEAQKQLVESEKMASLGALVAGVAHELNTPLGILLTTTCYNRELEQQLQQSFEKGQLTKKALQLFFENKEEAHGLIENNIHRATTLVDSFKRVAVTDNTEDARPFSLGTVFNDVESLMQPKFKSAGHQLEFVIDKDLEVYSVPSVLAQVTSLLLDNALDHGFEHIQSGCVNISAFENAQGWCEILLEDNGCGIDEGIRNILFDPFTTTKRGSESVGLGAHIAYNLVTQKLLGKIELVDTSAKGSLFKVSFPATQEAREKQLKIKANY